MKKLFLILGICLIGISTQAQKKNAKITFEVNGVCEMCKDRIEKATLKTKGVKFCNWTIDTHQLALIYDERKTNVEKIQTNIAAVGHDTEQIKATDEAYNSLHGCCKYDRSNFPFNPENNTNH
ncbi:heavy-metal-associated domain-containing protein [Lutibacter sp. TH_r2]|uniref:heavy-metal-associated domain-containing protein n=1 Tax=Lutibacter sp. TH_r2 TaxID=3082083 RepID=UPI002952E664|nr:heavy-metal-associated domain-containing protein [Lutibacter sp. TH_r2]MDV7187131.1 heavy-metal-associated domain-containing protein [Lutibacter sp. TH_r2]